MLDIPLRGISRNCEGVTRRDFLRVGSLGLFGLTLPEVLRARAAHAAGGAGKSTADYNCILIWLHGGPSHLDMFDPKPDAPQEIRGEFGALPTKTDGLLVSEHLPLLAQQSDKYTVLRSLTNPDGGHETATHWYLTGYRFNPALSYPAYGSVFAREIGFAGGMPPYVLIGGLPFGYGGGGYMGAQYNPFSITGDPNSARFSVQDVTLPNGVGAERVDRRRTFISLVDRFQKDVETRAAALKTVDEFYARAYELITSPVAKKAFNVQEEPDALREDYGRNQFGQSCLLARRLIEAGVRFVHVNSGGWDTHQNNFTSLKSRRLPELDRGYAALLKDLHQRGLLASTIVICMGEFGRTPKVNSAAGRDHWPYANFVTIGGGPIKTGMVVGATDERAERPKERPITVEDLAATIYRALGINPDKEYESPQGRPVRIAQGGTPVEEIFR